MNEALADVGNFKIGGRNIIKVRFVDDTITTAKTQVELQDMVNRLDDIGKMCGIEISINKSQVIGIQEK